MNECPHGIPYANFCARCDQYRRDRLAAAALTGLLANPDITARGWTSEQRATVARIQADDMIASLDKVRP